MIGLYIDPKKYFVIEALEQLGTVNLHSEASGIKNAAHKMRNASEDCVVIDLEFFQNGDPHSLNNSSDEDIRMYLYGLIKMSNKNYIILASSKSEGNPMLGALVSAGFYNIITAKDESGIISQLTECYRKPRAYFEAKRYLSETDISEPGEINKTKKTVTIAVAGAYGHAGTTTVAINTAAIIKNTGFSCIYSEFNQNNHILKMFESKILPNSFNDTSSGKISVELPGGIDSRLDMYYSDVPDNAFSLADFVVYDYGNFISADSESFFNRDFQIIVSGRMPWEIEALSMPLMAADYSKLMLIFNLYNLDFPANEFVQLPGLEIPNEIIKAGTGFIPDMLEASPSLEKAVSTMLKDYISDDIVSSNKRKSFLGLFGKK